MACMPSMRSGSKIENTENQFAASWDILSTAIKEIYKKNASKLSFEELYRNAYNMVLHKDGDKLYTGIQNVIQEHLETVTSTHIVPTFPLRPSGTDGEGVASGGSRAMLSISGQRYLKEVKSVWEHHTTCMLMIRDVLLYVDRVYVKPANKLQTYDLGLKIFKDRERTIETILDQVQLERNGEMIDRHAVKGVVDMMLSLENTSSAGSMVKTLYDLYFEPSFLESTRTFYTHESQDFLSKYDATQYLIQVERRLTEEDQRVTTYLSATTTKKLRTIVEQVMISDHVKAVCEMENSGLVTMLMNEKWTIWREFGNGHEEMRGVISGYIKEVGKGINEQVGGQGGSEVSLKRSADSSTELAVEGEKGGVANAANPVKWVEALLEVRERFDKIIETAFGKDKAFINEVNSAFEHVINVNPKGSEFISLFIDDNLKKGIKGKSEVEVDSILDKTITMFRLIGEKDVFERYYKQHLARRLLTGRSVSEDAERSMIGKLKIECGQQFTMKLEGMFIDMKLSSDLMKEFKSRHADSTDTPEITVNVLTATNWPVSANFSTASETIYHPPYIKRSADRFASFYLSKFSGRKLSWLSHMGSADLRADINVSTYAMVVLVGVFNDVAAKEAVTFQKIQDITQIPVTDLKRTLQSLSVAKYRILVKSSKGKDVSDEDTFTFNADQILSIVAGVNAMENESERSETMGKVDEDRRHEVEASIVRIMKSRKRLDHNGW
ncbi:Cullin [Chytridium lagenaria]|nr:Cullin [Chytridium lagenaria]